MDSKQKKRYFLQCSDSFCFKFYSCLKVPFEEVEDLKNKIPVFFYSKEKDKAAVFTSLKLAEKVALDISGMGIKVRVVESLTEETVSLFNPTKTGGPLYLSPPGRWMKVNYREGTEGLFKSGVYISLLELTFKDSAWNSHETRYDCLVGDFGRISTSSFFLKTPVIPVDLKELDFGCWRILDTLSPKNICMDDYIFDLEKIWKKKTLDYIEKAFEA